MRLLVHLPEIVSAPDSWSRADNARVLEVIQKAALRACATVGYAQVEVVVGERNGSTGTSAAGTTRGMSAATAPWGSGDVRERIDAARLRDGGDEYGVPSYQDDGAEVDLPLQESPGDANAEGSTAAGQGDTEAGGIIATASGDQIVREKFPETPVAAEPGNRYLTVGGSPYVIAGNLPRAMQWGANLFGGRGYAILESRSQQAPGKFYVAGMTDPFSIQDLGQEAGEGRTEDGVAVTLYQSGGRWIPLRDYHTVMMVTRERIPIVSLDPTDRWTVKRVMSTLKGVPSRQRWVDPTDLREVAGVLLGSAAASDSAQVDVIVNMDRTLFAAMPWQQRAHFLVILINAWTGEREEIAILEIIHATRSASELEAIFALLRQGKVYEQLFDDLDSRVYELLQMLGEYRPAGAINWRYLVELLQKSGFWTMVSPVPGMGISTEPLRDLQRMAGGLLDWLLGMWEGLRFLVTKPEQVIEGLGHLAEFLWVLEKADNGDPQAQTLVTQMMLHAGQGAAKALRGLEYAEELGSPYGQRTKGTGLGEDILGRLRAMLLFEVLSWFIGLGEIKAAINIAGELPERLAALARVLAALGPLAKAGEIAGEAAKLERVVLAIARAAEIAEDARALRLVELLPESHLASLNRIASAAPLSEGAGIDALRAALAGNKALLSEMERLSDAMAVLSKIESKAAQAGGMTADMAAGARRLLAHAPWNRKTMLELVEAVPAEHLDEFLRTMTFIPPERFARWGTGTLRELAGRPRAMRLLREAGAELVDAAWERSGRTWEGLDRFIEGLEARRGQIGDPAKYQQLLDRLSSGHADAYSEVANALHARRLAEATGSGQRAAYALARLQERGHATLLRELEEITDPALRNRLAELIAPLNDKELEGLETIAGLTRNRGVAANLDWEWDDLFRVLSPSDRGQLFSLVGDVAPHGTEGMELLLKRFMQGGDKDIQGALGQLLAARTLIERYGARSLRYEVGVVEGGLRREVDIEANIGGVSTKVEVKTNLVGNPPRPSFDEREILKDLVMHARTDYNDLIYLYHSSVSGQLPEHGERMLALFGNPAAGVPADPRLVTMFNQFYGGQRTLAQARQAFARWLASGKLAAY